MNEKSVSAQTPAAQRTLHPPAVFLKGITWMIAVLVPVVLVLTAVRLLLNPAFLVYEYNTPWFPPDPSGFTKEDRLELASLALDYLVNDAGIEFLGDQRFENGQPVYNDRELRHMVDVKIAVQATLTVWLVALVALIGLGVWAWIGGWMREYQAGLARGGWLTVILLISILALVLFSWRFFFVQFHNVFFEEGTWMFNYTDTLIRLFPERFWQDIFLIVGGFALFGGLLLGLVFRKHSSA